MQMLALVVLLNYDYDPCYSWFDKKSLFRQFLAFASHFMFSSNIRNFKENLKQKLHNKNIQ